MSDDDVLGRATRALREEGEVPNEAVRAVRTRTLEALRRGERRRSRVVIALVPIAAVLAAGAAFARSGHSPLAAWHLLLGDAPPAVTITAPPTPLALGAASTEAAPSVTPVPEPTAPVVAENTPLPVPATPPASAPISAAARASASADVDPEARALALYRTAHHLHFESHDFAGALAAWNEYLRAAPGGRLAVEAQYNRAIALLRLGRTDEAKAALAPFARGTVGGGYRQREAQALLDAQSGR